MEIALKREGEVSVKGEGYLETPPAAKKIDSDFAAFWELYGKKSGKTAARKRFASALKQVSAPSIMAAVRRYVVEWPDPKWRLNPEKWLIGQRWLDEPAYPAATADPARSKLVIY